MILKLNLLYFYFLQFTIHILYMLTKLICTLTINRNMPIILHDPILYYYHYYNIIIFCICLQNLYVP